MMRYRSAILLLGVLTSPLMAAGPSLWTQTSEADFRAGTFVNVVATNLGDLKLSRATKTLLEQDPRVSSVYALAQTPDGTIYAGTGPQGIVLKIKDDKVETAFTIEESIGVFSLAVDAKGRLLVGTGGEKGIVYRVDKEGDKPVQLYSSDDVQYVWSLKVAPDGTVYAATGPNGQLIAIAPDGKSKVLFDSTESNLLTLAYDGKGTLFAGSDPNGIVYKIDAATGKAFVLYDAEETEISALALDAAGNLYAGTGGETADSGEAEASTEQTGRPEDATGGVPITAAPTGDPTPPDPNPGRPEPEPRAAKAVQDMPGEAEPGDGADAADKKDDAADAHVHTPTTDMSGDLTETPAEGNAIYRIDPAGFVTEIFRQPALVLSIVEQRGTLLVGTGSEGFVYQLNPAAEENVVIAKLDPKQVMTMLPISDGRVVLGLANAGGIAAMSEGFAATGTYTSDVLDAKQVSRFGTLQMHGSMPVDASVTVATRSGNLKDANSTDGWSAWSDEKPANTFVHVATSPGRFFQYRLSFKSDGKQTPAVTDVEVPYQLPNLPPSVKSIKVEAATKANGGDATDATAETPAPEAHRMQTVTWEATDANSDPLRYTLYYRQANGGPWIKLKDDLKEATYAWDTKTVADGRYELRVTASDAAANPKGTGREAARVSDPVIVDNTAPVFEVAKAVIAGGEAKAEVKAVDKTSTIASIEFVVDSSQDWQAVAASDSIYDSPEEAASFSVASLSPGPHQIAVRATDSKGNQGFANLLVTVPETK